MLKLNLQEVILLQLGILLESELQSSRTEMKNTLSFSGIILE